MCLVYPAHENADYNIGFKPESKGEKKRAAGAKTLRPGVARGYSKGIFSKVSVCVCVCVCVSDLEILVEPWEPSSQKIFELAENVWDIYHTLANMYIISFY